MRAIISECTMRVYWKMPEGLIPCYQHELQEFGKYLAAGQLQAAWRHLERAHIIGQPWAIEHTLVHWEMLKFGFRIKSVREMVGQIPRFALGGIKSFVGKIPVGNTGGADVPALRPMEMPSDLKKLMRSFLPYDRPGEMDEIQ